MTGQSPPFHEGDEITSGLLYRRIYPSKNYFKVSDGTSPSRATSANFEPDKDGEVSMYMESEVTPEQALSGHQKYGLLQITVEELKKLGIPIRVIYTPRFGKGHVSVLGFSKKDQPRRRAAFASKVLNEPIL